jgi:hypothetical protein
LIRNLGPRLHPIRVILASGALAMRLPWRLTGAGASAEA